MTFRNLAGNVATTLAVASAVVVAGLAARRELFVGNAADPRKGATAPTPVRDWTKYASGGHRIGPVNAQVTIVEFADFECPFCARFARSALRGIRTKFPNQVAIVFRHWPLPYHRFAMPAARAAECAAAQDRFEAFHDLLYIKQDSLGLKSFGDLARESGIPNGFAFDRCYANTERIAAIDNDVAAVHALGGLGTPTVLINGFLYPVAPDSTTLDRIVSGAVRAPARTK
jgi:protein-disulfide isomerase